MALSSATGAEASGYTSQMPSRPLRRPSLLLLCLVVLCARLGGAHLHLCFDGQEAQISVHASEPGHSDAHHGDPAHKDQNLSLIGNALTGLAKLVVDLPTALAALWLVLGGRLIGCTPPSAWSPAHRSQLRFRRPPLRGPPLFSR